MKRAAPLLVLLVAFGCAEPETGPPPEDTPEDWSRPPTTALGGFPDGPTFPLVGDFYAYRATRTFDSSPGVGGPDSSYTGRTTISVDSLVAFAVWPQTYRVSRYDYLDAPDGDRTETRSEKWQILKVDIDTAATLADVGESFQGGLADEHAEPRPVIHFPLSDAPVDVGTWVVGVGTSLSRRYVGRDTLLVGFDLLDSPDAGRIEGSYDTYLVEDELRTVSTSVRLRRWWGEVGVVREETSSEVGGSTITTVLELDQTAQGDP